MKNQNFPCRERAKPKEKPNFSATLDSPLVMLSSLSLSGNTQQRVIRSLGKERKEAFHRMMWTNPHEKAFSITTGVNVSVLQESFRTRFRKIFTGRASSILQNQKPWMNMPIWQRKYWSLEIYWPATNAQLTKHHILPRSRGWINHEQNYFWMPRTVHDDFHDIFGTYTPIEQLAYLLLLHKQEYRIDFIRDMTSLLLEKSQNSYYKANFLRHNRVEY
jgi:hypothetical protein